MDRLKIQLALWQRKRSIRRDGCRNGRSRATRGGKGGGDGSNSPWKITHERHHAGMPKAIESEVIHLPYRLVRGPFLNSNPVSSNENAGAIFAVVTMNEDFGVAIKERKELRYLIVRGIGPAPNGDTDE